MRCEEWREESRVRGQAVLLRSYFFLFPGSSPPPVPKEIARPSLYPGVWRSLCEKKKSRCSLTLTCDPYTRDERGQGSRGVRGRVAQGRAVICRARGPGREGETASAKVGETSLGR